MKKKVITFDDVRRVGLELPDADESTSYGTPALKVKGQLFVRLHDERDKIVLRMPMEQREDMMREDPEIYFITDHYRDYPYVLVSFARLSLETLPDLLKTAHRAASLANKRRV